MHRHIAILLMLCLTLVGCRKTDDSRTTPTNKRDVAEMPPSRGLPYELALLIPRALYAGELRDTIDAILRQSTPALPQHEPIFRINVVYPEGHITDSGFSGRHLAAWRTFRLRLLVDTAPTTRFGLARDVLARPQVEVVITAPTPHELAMLLARERQRLVDIFVEAELRREADALQRKHSKVTADALQRLTDADGRRRRTVCVPAGLRASKVGIDFLWTGTNLADRDQNFLFFSYPWDGRPLSVDAFVAKHDSVLRVNIPGSLPGQWMQTARIDDQPLVLARARILNNVQCLEVRGLWELRAGALGGPFVALANIDTLHARVEIVEGFIYSPHSPKRPLIRQMEAALRTFH